MKPLRKTALSASVLAYALTASTRAALADEVRVRVLAPDDKPVVGAKLWVTHGNEALPGGATQAAKTDANGTATFDLSPLYKGSPLYGSVMILAPGGALDGGMLKSGDNTFQLTATRTVSGRVVDAKGAPVAGARVALSYLNNDGGNGSELGRSFAPPEEASAELAVRSDAQGNWKIGGIPEKATIGVSLSDERFANTTNNNQSEKSQGILLTAQPGGALEGRVVDDKGAPVANAQLYAMAGTPNDGNYSVGKTDADGKYRLTGILPSDAVGVTVQPPPTAELVNTYLGNLSVKADASTRAPDLIMTPGVVLSGVVTDAKTGKPIEGVMINAYNGKVGSSGGQSGADGAYRIRVLPGSQLLIANHPDYGSSGQQGPSVALPLAVKEGAAQTQDIALTPKAVFSGIAVDGNGKPLGNVKFRFGTQAWQNEVVTTGADGKWSVKTDTETLRFFGGDAWQIVSPKEPLKTSENVRVVLSPTTYETVVGRVVDDKGAPLSGVQLQLYAAPSDESGPSLVNETTAVSDAQGRYVVKVIAKFRPFQVKPQRDGYSVLSMPDQSKFQKKNDAWGFADIVMVKRDAKLLVRVLAADGKPVAGALALAERGGFVTAVTAADGSATLTDLGAGETLVTAVFGNASGSATATAADKPAEVTLTLRGGAPPAPRDTQRAYEILTQAFAAAKGNTRWLGDLAALMQPFDADLAAKLRDKTAASLTAASFSVSGVMLNEVFGTSNQESILLHTDEYLDLAESGQKKVLRAFFDAIQGLQLVESDVPRATQFLESSETELRSMTAADRGQAVYAVIITCAVTGDLAAKLKQPSAQGWFDFAMLLIDTEYSKDAGKQDKARSLVLRGALRGGEKISDYVAAQFSVGVRAVALVDEIEKPSTDAKTAMVLLDKLEATPEEKPLTDGRYREEKKDTFGRVVVALMPRVAAKDPAAALALARRVKSESYQAIALALAAQSQSGGERLKLLREAYEMPEQMGGTRARIAAMIYDLEPDAGKPLFATLIRELEEQQKRQPEGNGHWDQGAASLGFYLARADAAAARRMLEIGFLRARSGSEQQRSWDLTPFAMAMTALDLDRAMEMSLLLDDPRMQRNITRYVDPRAQRNIAMYVLASDSQRRTLSFDDVKDGSWQPRPDVP